MNFLFLRGQVPVDRDPREIMFDSLDECDDMWTHLFYSLLKQDDYGEIWYWGGERFNQFKSNYVERWVDDFSRHVEKNNSLVPDVIFCRGGFSPYESVVSFFPKALKIYYGAGKRFLPPSSNYDIILQDSESQLIASKEKFQNSFSSLFIKPAAENLFYPREVDKKYDVCFPANGRQENTKGHEFVFNTSPEHLSIYNLGNSGRLPLPKNVFRARFLREHLSVEMQKARVGIICSNSNDSCPRVLPELLASNIPVVIKKGVNIWEEKYINDKTGIISSEEDFWDNVMFVLENANKFSPGIYYRKELSIERASIFITELINSII